MASTHSGCVKCAESGCFPRARVKCTESGCFPRARLKCAEYGCYPGRDTGCMESGCFPGRVVRCTEYWISSDDINTMCVNDIGLLLYKTGISADS